MKFIYCLYAHLLIFIRPLCLFQDSSTSSCKICTYDSYNFEYFVSSNPSFEICSAKKPNISRKILVLTPLFSNSSSSISEFDMIYNDLNEALSNETLLVMQYLFSNVEIYLSRGKHLITKTAPNCFFKRTNSEIKLRPLNCSSFDYPDYCVANGNAEIFFETQNFCFSINGKTYIQNINFFGGTFENNFFEIEILFDDPNLPLPLLKIENTNFFYTKFGYFIKMSKFGGIIEINFVNIYEIYFLNGFFAYRNDSMISDGLNTLSHLDEIYKKINYSSFSVRLNSIKFEKVLSSPKLIDFSYFPAEIRLEYLDFSEISPNQNIFSKACLLSITQNINSNFSIYLSHLVFANVTNITFFALLDSVANISNIYVYNSSYYTPTFYFSKCKFLNFQDFTIESSACLSGDCQVLTMISTNFQINFAKFINIKQFGALIENSVGTINNTYLRNITLSSWEITIISTVVVIEASLIIDQDNFNFFFFFVDCQTVIIKNSYFGNFSRNLALISGTYISELKFLNVLLENFNYTDYIITGGMKIDSLSFESSTLLDLNMNKRVLYFVQKITISSLGTKFINIFILDPVSIFIKTSTGDTYWMKSHFINIYFNRYGFNLEGGNSYISDSFFFNMGWPLKILFSQIKSLSLYYMSLFYMWSLQNIYMMNSTFENTGDINLISGFFQTSLIKNMISISFCSFKNRNKNEEYFYHGLIITDAPKVYLNENLFEGIQCSNYNSILNQNGAVLILGASTFAFNLNTKIATVTNNIFKECECQNGGSLSLINYNSVVLNNIFVQNSLSTNKAGSLLLVSSSSLNLTNLYANNSKSFESAIIFIQNIINFYFNKSFCVDSFSNKSGAISTKNTKIISIDSLILVNSLSKSQGGGFFLNGGQTIVNNCVFRNVSSLEGGVFYLYYSSINISFVISCLNFANFSGGFMFMDNNKVVFIENSLIYNSSSESNGAVIFSNNINKLFIKNFTMENCITQNLGIMYLNNKENISLYYFEDIICKNNMADFGSCIFSESWATISLKNNINQNNAGSPLIFQWLYPINIDAYDIICLENKKAQNLLVLQGVQININRIAFYNNSLKTIDLAYIYLDIGTNLSISDIKITSQINFHIFQQIESSLILSKTSLNLSNVFYTLIQGEFANVEIIECFFAYLKNFSYVIQEEYLLSLESSFLKIYYSSFIEMFGPVLFLYDTNCFIHGSSFKRNIGISSLFNISDIYFASKYKPNQMNLTIISSFFENNEGGTSLILSTSDQFIMRSSQLDGYKIAKGIEIISIRNISISNSNFSNFLGSKGSAIILNSNLYFSLDNEQSLINVEINSCGFQNNTAFYGGAIFLQGSLNLIFESCKFTKNKAINNNLIAERMYGVGGAVVIKCLEQNICSLNIENSVFLENTADSFVPILFSTSILEVNEILIKSSPNEKNKEEITSFPVKIALLSEDYNKKQFFEFASGTAINLTFEIIDQFNQTVSQENLIGSQLVQVFPSENLMKMAIKNANPSNSKIGLLNFTNLILKGKPGHYFYLEINIKLYDFDSSVPYIFKNTFKFYSRNCTLGEIYNQIDEVCLKCDIGTYSFIDPMIVKYSQVCNKCPDNSYCPGGNFLIPKAGYWRMNNISTMIVSCTIPISCIGVIEDLSEIQIKQKFEENPLYFDENGVDFIHGTCLEGHWGNLCYECKQNYGKIYSMGTCIRCERNSQYLIAKLVGSSIVLVLYLLVNANFLADATDSQSIDVISKICINHVQKTDFVLFLTLKNFLNEVQDFFSFLNIFSFINEDLFSNDCHLQYMLNEYENLYVFKVMITWSLPFISSLLCYLCQYLFYLARRKFSKKNVKSSNNYILIFLMSIFLFYPLITKCSMSLINCIDLYNGQSFLYLSPNLRCWEGLHFVYFVIFGIIGIITWGFAFPLLLFILLKTNSQNIIKRISVISNSSKFEKKHPSKYEYFLKFFHKDYKDKYFFWECIIFIQKFLLCTESNMSSILGVELDFILFFMILSSYFYFLIKVHPFRISSINSLEVFSIVIVIVSKMLATILKIFENNTVTQTVFSILILGLNSVFFIVAGFFIIKLTQWKKLYFNLVRTVSSLSNRYLKPIKELKNLRKIDSKTIKKVSLRGMMVDSENSFKKENFK